jgi:hypothetical protein
VSREDNGKNQVRMNVYTPEGEEEWQNVKIIGAMQRLSRPWATRQMMIPTLTTFSSGVREESRSTATTRALYRNIYQGAAAP